MAPNLPVGRSETTVIHKGDLQVGISYRYTKRDVMRNGTEEVGNPNTQKRVSHTGVLNLNLGVSNRFSMAVSAPLLRLERTATGPMADESDTSTTFGDLSVIPRWFASPRIFGKPGNLQLGLGASLPTATSSFQSETNQSDFTSGTIDPIITATLAALVGDGANLFVSIYSRLTFGMSDGREAGDLLSARLGLSKRVAGGLFNASLKLRWLHIEPDVVTDTLGVIGSVGGADFYSLRPGLRAKLIGEGETALNGWLEVDIPFSQYVKGNQLTEDWSLSFGLNTGFRLFGHDEKPAPGLHKH